MTGNGKWRQSPAGIATAQTRGGDVRYMDPLDALALLPPIEDDARQRRKGAKLLSSLFAGDEIEDVATIDVSVKNGRAKVADYDGRHRLQAAIDAGVALVPVSFTGLPKKGDAPTTIEGMSGGVTLPFDFRPVPKAVGSPGPMGGPRPDDAHIQAAQDAMAPDQFREGAELGALRPVVGTAQLAGHGLGALGLTDAAELGDWAVQRLESRIAQLGLVGRMAAVAGDIGVSMAFPVARLGAGAGALARLGGAALTGAAAGAAQPVTDGAPENYWGQKFGQAGLGAAAGGGLQLAGEGVNAASRLVGPSDRNAVTGAVAELLGADRVKKFTPQILKGIHDRIVGTLNQIEDKYAVHLDAALDKELQSAVSDARALFGEGDKRIVNIVDGIVSRADRNGDIPATAAATLWHHGAPLDRLTESADPDLSRVAQRIQGAMRSALERQIPADEAKAYREARRDYLAYKLVLNKSLNPQGTQVLPNRLVSGINRKFPNGAAETNPLPIQELGRAAAETWPAGGGGVRQGMGYAVGGAIGGAIGHAVVPGWGLLAAPMTAHLLADILGRNFPRLPTQRAEAVLRPSPGMFRSGFNAMRGFAPQVGAGGGAFAGQMMSGGAAPNPPPNTGMMQPGMSGPPPSMAMPNMGQALSATSDIPRPGGL